MSLNVVVIFFEIVVLILLSVFMSALTRGLLRVWAILLPGCLGGSL